MTMIASQSCWFDAANTSIDRRGSMNSYRGGNRLESREIDEHIGRNDKIVGRPCGGFLRKEFEKLAADEPVIDVLAVREIEHGG